MMENEGESTGMIKGIHFANGYMAFTGLVYELHFWVVTIQHILGKTQGVNLLLKLTKDQLEAHREAMGRRGV
jgi:hypothetical protein